MTASPRTSGPNSPCTAEDSIRTRICTAERATVRDGPSGGAVSELLHGEAFAVKQALGMWLFGRCMHDNYPGCVSAVDFAGWDESPLQNVPTHHVIARTGLVFAAADLKAPVIARPPMGAVLRVRNQTGDYLELGTGFVHRRHVAPTGAYAPDPVEVAARLLGAPYLWGGRSGDGIDCSGLIQLALAQCGIAAPRDSTPQRALGHAVDPANIVRGDLVFFPGHVGIMASATDLLHANAHWMTTLIEPLADVVARLAPVYAEPIVAVRRLDLPGAAAMSDHAASA